VPNRFEMNEKNKILIIDDTVDIVDLLQKRLRVEGYEIFSAYDGEEGLRQVAACAPDLVILDVMMPKLDGFEVLKRLKADEKTRYIPVLMLTARAELPDKIQGFEIGADDYLTKPFDYKELAVRVKSLFARKAANEKLAEEEKSGALDHMLDEVAHEVRNPLVIIGGLARRVLKKLPEDSREREYLDIILANVAALEKMVTQLFALKSAALSYIEPADINEIIGAALGRFAEQLAAQAIAVETRLECPSMLIPVDRENLIRAIACLIENALEAMIGEIRRLTIITRQIDGNVEILLSDTGKGISRETIKNIFDPFFTSKIYGPGLGLTFVLKTVQSHKGKISVESEVGKGTTFSVKLPGSAPV